MDSEMRDYWFADLESHLRSGSTPAEALAKATADTVEVFELQPPATKPAEPPRKRRPFRLCRAKRDWHELETVYSASLQAVYYCGQWLALSKTVEVLSWLTPEYEDEPIGEPRDLESRIMEAWGRLVQVRLEHGDFPLDMRDMIGARIRAGELSDALLEDAEHLLKSLQAEIEGLTEAAEPAPAEPAKSYAEEAYDVVSPGMWAGIRSQSKRDWLKKYAQAVIAAYREQEVEPKTNEHLEARVIDGRTIAQQAEQIAALTAERDNLKSHLKAACDAGSLAKKLLDAEEEMHLKKEAKLRKERDALRAKVEELRAAASPKGDRDLPPDGVEGSCIDSTKPPVPRIECKVFDAVHEYGGRSNPRVVIECDGSWQSFGPSLEGGKAIRQDAGTVENNWRRAYTNIRPRPFACVTEEQICTMAEQLRSKIEGHTGSGSLRIVLASALPGVLAAAGMEVKGGR